jgi:hypothetical protein
MCKGISVLRARIQQELYDEYLLEQRLAERGGETELRFMYTDKVVVLPVLHAGQHRIYEWGNRGNKESKLPRTGWCRNESLQAGKWRWLQPEPVEIPANLGLEKGVWFHITEGLRGIVVNDEQHRPHVYMLTQAASHYYATMTKHDRMPLLVGQEI